MQIQALKNIGCGVELQSDRQDLRPCDIVNENVLLCQQVWGEPLTKQQKFRTKRKWDQWLKRESQIAYSFAYWLPIEAGNTV